MKLFRVLRCSPLRGFAGCKLQILRVSASLRLCVAFDCPDKGLMKEDSVADGVLRWNSAVGDRVNEIHVTRLHGGTGVRIGR